MTERIYTNPTPNSKVWNIPNLLTYGRIVIIPLVAGLLMWPGERGDSTARWIALFLFIVAAITDFFDGYLARRWHLTSSLGRMLDPIADKVLVAVILLVLSADGILFGGHIWAAIIILSREVLVSGLREYLGQLRVSVPVTRIAKYKTTVQLLALGFLIAGPAGDRLLGGLAAYQPVSRLGIGLLWIAAGLTLYTGWDYFRAGIRHVVDR